MVDEEVVCIFDCNGGEDDDNEGADAVNDEQLSVPSDDQDIKRSDFIQELSNTLSLLQFELLLLLSLLPILLLLSTSSLLLRFTGFRCS